MGAPVMKPHGKPELWFNLGRSEQDAQFRWSMFGPSARRLLNIPLADLLRERPSEVRPVQAEAAGAPAGGPYTDIRWSTSASTIPDRGPASTTCPRSITA